MVGPISSEQKIQDLRDWVSAQLQANVGDGSSSEFSWNPLQGDAGFRQYFRVGLPHCKLIAAYSPPETENNNAFVQIDQSMMAAGVRVPKVVAYDLDLGYLLLEDLGDQLLLAHLNDDSVHGLYGEALLELLKIQQCSTDTNVYPPYDRTRLLDELRLFPEWFVGRMLSYSLTDDESAMLQATFDGLIESALAQTQVVVHRDYHCRNLVVGDDGVLGVIDFQDAVVGPITYDLVSLLRDCYVAWPNEQVQRWALAYGNMAVDAGLMSAVSEEQFLRWFDLMGLQRHIKVLGIFARLSLRDNKHGYLNDLPMVVNYVRAVAKQQPSMSDFIEWFDKKLLPVIEQQSWWKSEAGALS